MRIPAAVHSSPVHLAILRIASLLVPGEGRTEWLAEWQSELWYATRECRPESARWPMGYAPLTTFCLGSLRDALWLRRNAPRLEEPVKRRLESPVQCIAFLGVLAAVSGAIAFLLWVATQATVGLSDLDSTGLFAFLFIFLFPFPILPAITSLSLGKLHEHNKGVSWGLRLRRWTFLSAKVALIWLMLYCGVVILACNGAPFIPPQLQLLGLLFGYVAALRWVLNDQRQRCPVCLRLLTSPVSVGGASRCFLESSCMGFMCPSGHGLLYVPENPTSWFSTQRWLSLDPSWSNLSGKL